MKSTRFPRSFLRAASVGGLVLVLTATTVVTAKPAPTPAESRITSRRVPKSPQPTPSFGAIPLSFEANVGQGPPGASFLTRGASATITTTGAVLSSGEQSVTLEFSGTSSLAKVSGGRELPGKAHYIVGEDASHWKTNVPTYATVRVEQLYPGVDIVWYGNDRSLEYDLVVAPGANPGVISFVLSGTPSLVLGDDGALVAGDVRLERPIAFQEANGVRMPVASRYDVGAQGHIVFALGEYDRSLPLVIDPEIRSTYRFAEPDKDFIVGGVTVDSTGATYVVGSTSAAGTGARDILVTKLNPAGTAVVYTTTIGGARSDQAYDVAVDDSGNAYVTGETFSNNFPTTAGVLQTAFASSSTSDPDAFVVKIAPSGASLSYATYLGGAKFDHGKDIVIDGAGNAYVTGTTTSTNFPTTVPDQAGNGGSSDAFATMINPSGSAKVWSTYLGGSEGENGEGIAIDSAGNAIVVGATFSANFPVTTGALQSTFGGGIIDGFWAKYDATGQRVGSTYLGGSGVDLARAVAVDAVGHAFLTGETDVTDFPVASRTHAKVSGGSREAFIAEVNPEGAELEITIFYGGNDYDAGYAVDLNLTGFVLIAGETHSTDLPLVDPVQPVYGGGISDGFVLQCDPDATGPDAVGFCTYEGDERANFGVDCSVGPSDEVSVCSNAPDLSPNGEENDECVVTEYELAPPGPRPDLKISLATVSYSTAEGASAHVLVIIRSTNECQGPNAPNARFSVDVPVGLGVTGASGYDEGGDVRVVSRPPDGEPGTVSFELARAVKEDGSDRALVRISLALGSPSSGPLLLEATASTSALECNYDNNAITALPDVGQRTVKPGARLLEINSGTDATAPPTVRVINDAAPADSGPQFSRTAGGATGVKVYASTQPGVQTIPGNLFASLPPGQTSVDVSETLAGSFFVVTTVSDSGESPPSNEVGGVLPTIRSLKVSASKVIVQGTGFVAGVQVLFGGLPFATAAKLKKNNTKIVQKGPLLTGTSIGTFVDELLGPGTNVTILIVNPNGNGVAAEYNR